MKDSACKKSLLLLMVLMFLSIFNVINASGSFPIATTGDGDLSMAAAFDGTNYLAGIEYNQKNTANQINTYVGAQMLSPTGAKIGSLIETSQHGIAGSIAFDGTNYLIVWEDNEGRSPNDCNFALYGQLISKAGAAVGTSFVISSGIIFDGLRTLSYGGGKYLVTYTKLLEIAQCENSTNRYIAGRLIETNGTMGTEFRISTGNGAQNTMAFDGTNFFVVWVEDSQDKEVRGRFVSTTGVLGTEISINASAAPSDNPLGAAFDGTNYLVVWNDEVSGGWDIFGQRISPTGALVGGVITITSETGPQMATGIAFDGTNYLVSWVDMKNDANGNGICDAGESTCWDVYGKYISKSGTTVGSKFVINTDAGNQLGGVGGFADGKYFAVINTGIFFGVDSLQGGDVYGMFITPPVAEGSIQLSSATYSVSEAGPEVTITATRTGGSSGAVGISYATSNGTAIAGSDYTSASGTLSWTDGDTANKTFNVSITNDTLSETSDIFTVTLSTPTGGATLGSPSSATVTITDNDSPPNILTVIKSGTGSGDVVPNIGTLTWIGNQGTGPYSAGDTVVLTATPAFRSSFTVWKGCTTMLGNTCTLSMTTAKTVTATFVVDIKYAVKVKVKAKGSTATGMITSDPAGISCPLDCTESYWKDEVVTLTATPPAGFMFSGWSGACIGTESTCTLTMTAKKSVSAVFIPYPALTVIKSGTGAGTITSDDDGINCGNVDTPDCSEVYTTPDTVTLTATPGLHSSFTVWKGCTTMIGNTCTVSMAAAKTVTATFVADTQYALKVVKSGTGTGTITSDPTGVSCPADCTESYWKNEVVTLTATPMGNSSFVGWSGSCTGTQNTCTLTMTAAKSVTATFKVVQVAAVLVDDGPFGALMVASNGEILLPLVDRDASGNPTKITGAMYTNSVTGVNVVVYLGDNGLPTETIIGDYTLLFSNWSADGKSVDIAKIHAPTNYIEIFKGVSIDATFAPVKNFSAAPGIDGSLNSMSMKTSCLGHCDTDIQTLSELLKFAGLGIQVGSCISATYVSLGLAAIPCAGVIVNAATLVVGNETWLQNLDAVGAGFLASDGSQCILTKNVVSCISAGLDVSSRLLDVFNKTSGDNIGINTTAELFLSDSNQPSGVVQQGSGLPSCTSSYECTPGGAMSYLPCYPDGVRECKTSCTWGSCFSTCGDGDCDRSIAGENNSNCPADCPPVCGDGICSTGENNSGCPQDCPPLPPSSYTLSVSKSGTGSGTVTSSPSGISCGSSCSSSFSTGSSVTLTAKVGTGSTFTGWSGVCTGTGSCKAILDSNKSVTANFTNNEIAYCGNGRCESGENSFDCPGDCANNSCPARDSTCCTISGGSLIQLIKAPQSCRTCPIENTTYAGYIENGYYVCDCDDCRNW